MFGKVLGKNKVFLSGIARSLRSRSRHLQSI